MIFRQILTFKAFNLLDLLVDIWNQLTQKEHTDSLLILWHIWVDQCVSSIVIQELLQESGWGLCTI